MPFVKDCYEMIHCEGHGPHRAHWTRGHKSQPRGLKKKKLSGTFILLKTSEGDAEVMPCLLRSVFVCVCR